MASHDDAKDIFREFLADFNNEFTGKKLKILRFLLYDHLTISLLAREDISGFDLFNQLHSQGDISYGNVSILYEIAEITKKSDAIDLIKDYREEIPHDAKREYKGLTPYRRALFAAMEHVAPQEVVVVRNFYDFEKFGFDNIWDVVFQLEIEGRLDSTEKKLNRFIKRLNKKAGDKLSDFLKKAKAEPTSSVKASADKQPTATEGQKSASKDKQSTTTEGQKSESKDKQPTTTEKEGQKSSSKEMTEKEFNILLEKLSKWYEGTKYTYMLNMLFSGKIPAADYSTPMELFKAVKTAGLFSRNDIRILLDMVKVTNTLGVLNSVEALSKSWDNAPVKSFSQYRQMLIALGNELSQKDSETLGNMYGIPLADYNSDQWILIMKLERKGEISEDNMQSFIKDLKEVDLCHAARTVERFTN